MFGKILDKFKERKHFKLPFENQRFQFSDLTLKLNLQNFRPASLDFKKLLEPINKGFQSMNADKARFVNSKPYQSFRVFSTRSRRYFNKKMVACCFAGMLALHLAYEYSPYRTKIGLSYDNNEFNNKLISSLSHLKDTHFYPAFSGTKPLLQAIMNVTPPEDRIRYIREPLVLPDGGQVTLDWALPVKKVDFEGILHLEGRYYPYNPPKDTKILLMIHGLTGGSETNYIQSLVNAASREGYRVVVMNQRGVNQLLTTPLPFHGGCLKDMEFAIDHVKKLYPDAPLVALGTSFGGNQLVRHLGNRGDKTKIDAAVLLSAPFDIDDCVDGIHNTVYETFFVRSYFEKNFLPHIDTFQTLTHSHGINIEEILRCKTLRDYHRHFTVKVYEHKDVREYFVQTKVSDDQVKNVTVPMLVLHAKDDPIACHKSIPIEELRRNPNIIYAETNHGGHLGWFTGLKPRRWYGLPSVEFLNQALELKRGEKSKVAENNNSEVKN